MKKKIPFIILGLVLLFIFILIYIFNSNTEFVTDDFIYQFVFESRMPTSTTKLLSNPLDIFKSMANHWALWGGRVSVHFLLQFAFLLGRSFFDFFNSLMFMALGLLMYFHIKTDKKINIPLLVVIYAVIFLFVPQPGSTILWKSGSANYLWSSVLMLIMTLIFKKHLDNKESIKDNKRNSTLLFMYGLFIGCANENSGCALIVAIILFMIAYKIKYKNVPKWCYFALTGTIISFILLLLSPGNYIRTEEMYPGVKYGLFNLIDYAFKITRLTYEYIGIIFITAIVTFVVIASKRKNIKEYITDYGVQIIFFAYALISIYSLVVSPAYPERCWMFAFVYLVIIIGQNLNFGEDSKYSSYIKKLYIILMIILSFKAIGTYNEAYYDIVDTKACIEDHKLQIKNQISDGKKNVVVHSFPEASGKYNAFTFNGYLTYNPDSWTNRWIAEYYGASSIIAEN